MPLKENIQQIEEVAEHVKNFLECDAKLKIEWNRRFRRRVADALYTSRNNVGRLRFSTFLWPYVDMESRKNIITHEVCHIVHDHWRARQRQLGYNVPRSPHGKQWQMLMRRCGELPNRLWRPSEETINKLVKDKQKFDPGVPVRCKCRVFTITKNRAGRIRNGRIYHCLRCKGCVNLILGTEQE